MQLAFAFMSPVYGDDISLIYIEIHYILARHTMGQIHGD